MYQHCILHGFKNNIVAAPSNEKVQGNETAISPFVSELTAFANFPTHQHRSDVFTKALSGTVFKYPREVMRMMDGDVYRRAMIASKVAHVPQTVWNFKMVVALFRLRAMLAKARWYRFLLASIQSNSHQLTFSNDRVHRLVRLVVSTTKRILHQDANF